MFSERQLHYSKFFRLRIYESHIFELRIKMWMKVILAVMHTTCQSQWEVVKTRPEFFFRPYFHYFSSSVHHCEDHFQSRLNFSGHHTLSHQLMSESVLTELQATPWSNYKTQSVSFLVLYDDWSTLKIVSVIISYFLNTMSNPELIYSITDFLLGAVSS